ncbi:DUF5687 family protein [Flavobacterium ardleyense]|uniref:DUF5687 family protein n=1 Tax=Flavobacterium ardleyense TaxID=2038737 RepID=UPI00298BF3ED|nr:DUF5687 family protein [Flavobacterium ardleyense]
MIKKFLYLEWKAFVRSASFGNSVAMKILMGFVAVYFMATFLLLGIGVFFIIKEEFNLEPLATVNKYLIFYFLADISARLALQKIPVINIKPLLLMNIRKSTIVKFALGKTVFSVFNFLQLFFFVPFTIVLLVQGYDILSTVLWFVAMMSIVYFLNFLNIILNNKDNLFTAFLVILAVLAALQYYEVLDITVFTFPFFDGISHTTFMWILPVAALVFTIIATYKFFLKGLSLDSVLVEKHTIASSENFSWLERFGKLGTFLKNDLRLITRNKRAKSTLFVSVMFLFYGLIFFKNPEFDSHVMKIFAGIFVTGGFLFTYGQYVPSWDSAYYPLMMTQNINYREYLNSKWWLIVIATIISTAIAAFYLMWGWEVYLAVLVGGIYNIGVNSHLVLLTGAYIKTPIDLQTSKGMFGDKKAFNAQSLLLTIPKLILPLALYFAGNFFISPTAGLIFVAAAGILGFLFRNLVFAQIEKVYKKEKYKTIQAYKQSN